MNLDLANVLQRPEIIEQAKCEFVMFIFALLAIIVLTPIAIGSLVMLVRCISRAKTRGAMIGTGVDRKEERRRNRTSRKIMDLNIWTRTVGRSS